MRIVGLAARKNSPTEALFDTCIHHSAKFFTTRKGVNSVPPNHALEPFSSISLLHIFFKASSFAMRHSIDPFSNIRISSRRNSFSLVFLEQLLEARIRWVEILVKWIVSGQHGEESLGQSW